MLTKPTPPPLPNAMYRGFCATCKTEVVTEYYKAVPPRAGSPGRGDDSFWTDLPYAECPKCRARVYLRAV